MTIATDFTPSKRRQRIQYVRMYSVLYVTFTGISVNLSNISRNSGWNEITQHVRSESRDFCLLVCVVGSISIVQYSKHFRVRT